MGILDTIKNIGRNVAAVGSSQMQPDMSKQEAIQRARQLIRPQTYIQRNKSIYKVGGVTYHATKSKGISHKSAGRPKQSYKPRLDPLTGRVVRMPATVLYKRARLARRLQSAKYQQRQMQKAQFYQQRGIPPQQAARIEMVRQQKMAQQLAQQPQQTQQFESYTQPTLPTQQMPMRQQYRMEQQRQVNTIRPDFFRGGTTVAPKERWLQ